MYAQHTSRTARIASIIEKRRPLAEKIAGVEANLKSLASALRNLEDNRDRLLTRVDDSNVIGQLREIDFSSIQLIEDESKKLNTLRKRLSRPTLNIGVVGRMGQGKSTLLKSLSGLTDNEIPAYEGGACTAVRSTIENKDGATIAEVTLHSEQSFLEEVIWLYYDKLGFTDKPTSLDDFANKPFPEQSPSGATNEETYKRLREDYHKNLEQYRHLLASGTIRTFQIRNEEIPDYVIQKRDQDRRLTTFKHLAVREVKIFCPFQNSDAGRIALVDVPGLGDTKLGDEELMLRTLGQEVDVVLFIRRPDWMRYQWEAQDTKLYDMAAEALNNLADRSFMILNHSINNLRACEALQSSIDTINVVRCEVADCSNPDDANRVFDLVLDYLSANIAALDKQYASSRQERIAQLQSAVEAELEKARNAFGRAAAVDNQIIEQEFSKLFGNDRKGWWKDVALGLEKLRSELWLHRQAPNNNFQAGVDAAIQACQNYKGILSSENPVEEINERIMVSGSLRAYADYRDEIRVLLSHHFLSLDEGLKQSIENVKSQVADVLIHKGNLGVLTDAQGSEFIKELQQSVDEAPSDLKRLKQGLEIFAEFELSYRGLMQHRIRKHLDGLTNIIPTNSHIGHIPDRQTDTLHPTASTSAEEILLALQIEYETAVNLVD